jgi:hypothetical protein
MNRDSEIIIYGSAIIMIVVAASSLVCGCSRMAGHTLVQTGVGLGIAGFCVAGGYEWLHRRQAT